MLEAVDVTFGYERAAPVLVDWGARMAPGEIVALTGASGCGKSTLLYLFGLMLRPVTGEVRLDGNPVSALPDRTRAKVRAEQFGFVFQDAVLDPTRSVLHNVCESALYRGERRSNAEARARVLLERFGVGHRAGHRPGEISGGQAQRIALCRALLGSPRVLLADEPTGNLDHDSADLVLDGLVDHARTGSAVVVATHDESVVQRCDRRLVL